MKKIGIFIALVLLSAIAQTVHADEYGCNGQYGSNCSPTSITINKLVGKPVVQNGQTVLQFVDNLSYTDYTFKPGDIVTFELVIKNTSSQTLNNVTVRDYLPAYLSAVEGPGTFDNANKLITFTIGSMNAGEEKTYTLKTSVVSDTFPSDKSLICMVNKATVASDTASNEDTAQLCAQKQVTGVTQVPSTGPEMGLLLMTGELALLGLGLHLKRKA